MRIAHDNWKQTEDIKKMKSSKAKSAKLRKALKDLRKLNNITCINAESPGTAVTDLLLKLTVITAVYQHQRRMMKVM